MSTKDAPAQPKLTKDPRFRAARKLIESGRDGAVEMFGLLLEEARTKYGEASVETAPAYCEYGMALFRESQRQKLDQEKQEQEGEEEEEEEEEEDKKPAAIEKESKNGDQKPKENGDDEKEGKEKDASKDSQSPKEGGKEEKTEEEEEEEGEDQAEEGDEEEEEEEGEEEEEDDEELAFSMLETAFAIYDQYVQLAKSSPAANSTYLTWAEREQLPRILSNIGDLLSCMGRHADSADAYTRELLFRDNNLQAYENNSEGSLAELQDRRKNVEANVLVATELLACPAGEDVVTTETKSCLVKADERDDYATGYYEQARDQLQETVYLMAKLLAAAKDKKQKDELAKEKENICFASALVMGVGEKLAEREDKTMKESKASSGPAKKKAKLG